MVSEERNTWDASAEKRLVEYPNACHTLEFETDPEPYFRDLITWLSALTAADKMRHE